MTLLNCYPGIGPNRHNTTTKCTMLYLACNIKLCFSGISFLKASFMFFGAALHIWCYAKDKDRIDFFSNWCKPGYF